MKKIAVLLLVAVAGFWCVKKTSLLSYAGTLWSQVRKETNHVVPTKFELDRVRHEIANMEGDISNMLRPIAEHMAAITRLKKDMHQMRANLAEQKTVMLTMTRDLESNPTSLVYGGETFSVDRVRTRLQRDFESYKRLEGHLKSQEKLLDAKERSLTATREQLAKLIAKKREYEVRVAQLEADEETLQIARIGSKLQLDDSRATEIEAALTNVEQRHDVQRAEVELKTGSFAQDMIPVNQRPKTRVDLNEIRNYLQGVEVDTSITAIRK